MKEGRPTSTVLIASTPLAMEKRVSLVTVLLVVRIAYKTLGSSSIHALLEASNFFFKGVLDGFADSF